MEITNLDCANYINVNWHNVIPMTEAEFRTYNFDEFREVIHGSAQGRYLCGVGHIGQRGVFGYYDFQREAACYAPGTNPV